MGGEENKVDDGRVEFPMAVKKNVNAVLKDINRLQNTLAGYLSGVKDLLTGDSPAEFKADLDTMAFVPRKTDESEKPAAIGPVEPADPDTK